MNRRLEQFLRAENISQSQFADSIGVARASVSHILSGRNKPGFDFLLNTAKAYPALNLEWLITGKGRMYASGKAASSLFEDDEGSIAPRVTQVRETSPADISASRQDDGFSEHNAPKAKASTLVNNTQTLDNERNISKIVIFFDDNTFQEYRKD